jgi:hypothetical protein
MNSARWTNCKNRLEPFLAQSGSPPDFFVGLCQVRFEGAAHILFV